MLNSIPQDQITGLAIVAVAVFLWLFWQLSRRIVRWGFMIFYFLLGACAAWLFNPSQGPTIPIVAGLAFSYTVMSIKAKIWKFITGTALLVTATMFFPGYLETGKFGPSQEILEKISELKIPELQKLMPKPAPRK